MSRTVTALYDSRAEAETARARLIAGIKTESTRIIGKDTVAAVDTLKFEPEHKKTYLDTLAAGGHLLVAEVEAGQEPKQIVALLEPSAGREPANEVLPPDTPTYGFVGVTDEQQDEEDVAQAPDTPAPVRPEVDEPVVEQPKVQAVDREAPDPRPAATPPVQQVPQPRAEEELRVGMPHQARGGARVRSVMREEPAEERVALSEEHIDVEHRESQRRLSAEDVNGAGLLRERVFEIREMREEPVVTKEAFVREEVIVRKRVQKRTETIRDTVRRTDFETEETAPTDERGGAMFGGRAERR